MIKIKSAHEIELMREAGRITALSRVAAVRAVKPGVTTGEIDRVVHDTIVAEGAIPTFLNYNGFPASACISVNDEVIHGIPSFKHIIHEGDIVKLDVGAMKNGFTGDCAITIPCGDISEEARKLIEVTRQSFYEGIRYAREGCRLSDISHAIQTYVESHGFSVVRDYVGHGVGANLHESPEIPNFGIPGHGVRLRKGMTLAIEPMVNVGGYDVKVLENGWTVKTRDGSLSSHYENSVLITDGEPEILTAVDGEVL